jgi:hypothetical protein
MSDLPLHCATDDEALEPLNDREWQGPDMATVMPIDQMLDVLRQLDDDDVGYVALWLRLVETVGCKVLLEYDQAGERGFRQWTPCDPQIRHRSRFMFLLFEDLNRIASTAWDWIPAWALAAIQQESPTSIGFVIRSNPSLLKSWLPVHRNARCETQTWLPITTRSRLRIITSSPIHTWSPISNRHGIVMFTRLRITTPAPIFAPKSRSTATLIADGTGNHGAKKSDRDTHQSASLHRGTPRE